MGKGETGVIGAIEDIRKNLPFALMGVDSDSGSEFVNHHLLRYCKANEIELTRAGHPRRTTTRMNDLYKGDLRLLQNLFLPSVNLLKRERVGSKARRYYDDARTPLDRVIESAGLHSALIAKLKTLRDKLDPFALSASAYRRDL